MPRPAADTAHPYAAPHRPALRVVGGSRGNPATVRVRATLVADLMDELRACGQEMEACGRRVEYAIHAERPDVALHVASSLIVRGARYANPKVPA